PQWRTPNTLGTYTLKAWTELSTDEDRSNDTVRMTIEVTNWLFYADFNSPYWYTWATPEKGVFIVPNEFGVSYPIQVESLKAVFYRGSHVWRDSTFRFKIYGEDFRTLLYASPWIEAVPPPGGGMVEVKHYLSTPVQITDGNFLITVDCYGDSGYPDLLADGVPQYRSVFGDSLQWYYWDYGELMIASFVNWGASPHDVGFSNIHAPLMYTEPGQNMTPIGVVTNYGTENETAVRCSCFVVDTLTDARVYSGYASIPSLPAGETAVVQFPQWAVPAGNNVYQVQMATFLPDDGNPYNDAIYHVFFGFHIVDQLYSPRVSPTVTVDGYLDPNEWAEANRYDISNIMGFADPYYRYFPNNAWLYVMHDENRLYLGGDLTFVTYSDSTEFGLYFDENNDGAWAGDSSEGNYWALHRPRTTPVDSIIYRSLPSGWRTTPPGCVSRTSYASGHEQFEVALPFGTAKHQLNCNPDGDTVGFYAFLMSEIYNMWPGWWHTLMDENYWNQPAYYHKLVLGPKLRFDVAAKQVLVPTGTLDTGTTFTPTAKWRNEHTTPADFSAFFTITDPAGTQVYLQSQSLTAVPGQTDTTLRFLNFTVRDTGIWSVRCSTWCQGDTNPANDVITSTFRVRLPVLAGGWFEMAPAPPGAKAFKDGGWLAIEDGIIYAAKGNKSGEFYSFDPLAGSNGVWTTLASIPNGTEAKPPYKGAVGVAAGKYIYATKGNNTLGFWRYNIDSAAWQQMPDVPLGASGKRVKGGTDMVYVQGTGHDTGYVYLLKGINQEFFRFNTATGTWDTSLPPAPAGAKPKWDKGSWLALQRNPGHSIYRIYAHKAKYHELWVFDHVTRTWSASPLPGMPLVGMMGKSKKSKDGGCGAWYDNGIYALKGGNTQEFWYFDVPTSSWQELDTMPSVGSTAKKKRVKAGADIVAYGDGTFYALKGNKTLELWRYRLAAALAGQTLPERSGVMAEPARLTRPEFNVMSPARGRTVISYVLPQASAASVTVFDVAGRTVVRQVLTGRSGRVTLELGSLSAGVYLVRCDGAGFTATRKLVVE
ncbi:MAG: T9SS type A sorting domain-containing protein, partial [candidate division WOR-3 bacterium]